MSDQVLRMPITGLPEEVLGREAVRDIRGRLLYRERAFHPAARA